LMARRPRSAKQLVQADLQPTTIAAVGAAGPVALVVPAVAVDPAAVGARVNSQVHSKQMKGPDQMSGPLLLSFQNNRRVMQHLRRICNCLLICSQRCLGLKLGQ
jgi:hypothetical protein